MNRELIYTGQLLPVTSLLRMARDPMIAFAKLASGVLGASTKINGFACTPTGPASMQVQIGAGEIYAMAAVDSTAFGDLGVDARQVLKQGLLLDPVLLAFAAPATAGQSVNYLVQVSLQDQDVEAAVLPYYNSGTPSSPFLGPNGTGTSQATRRNCAAVVSIKAGGAAATGTQTTPAPDAGFVGAWVVAVANGQTTITGPNITAYALAPFIGGGLDAMLRLAGGQAMTGRYDLAGDAVSALQATPLQQVQALIAASGGAPIGFPGHWSGATPPAGWIKRNGALLPRSGVGSYPLLTALVLSGNVRVVSEAAWPSNPGAFTLGDGATTIRIPDARGLTDKGYHDGSGTFTTDTTRALGSYGPDTVKDHTHTFPIGQRSGGDTGIASGSTSGWTATPSTLGVTGGGGENTVRDVVYMPIIRAY